jgi:uncharacterized YkwD family protein
MKKKITILAVLTLLVVSTAGFASAESTGAKAVLAFEKTEFTDAEVTASVLNVRQGPSVTYPVISKLEKGQSVRVIGKIGEWYAVYNLKDGCLGAVDGKYLTIGEAALQASLNDSNQKAAPSKETPSKSAPSKTTPSKTTTSELTGTIDGVDVSQDEQKLLELVNRARKEAGVEPLALDEELMSVARLKAGDMVDNNYFSHQSPTYGSPFDMMRQFDNTFKTAGENIAGNKTIEGAFKAWMGSDDHKKNILNSSFSITGIGVASSQTYGKILVQQFIGR